MKVINVCLPDNHEIVLEGDEHRGSFLFHEKGLQQCHDYIMDKKNRYVVKMGDLIEAITCDDKRYNPKTNSKGILNQLSDCLNMMVPIRNRILTILDGNHENTLSSRLGDNVAENWCYELNKLGKSQVHHGTYTCIVQVNDLKGNLMYKLYATHGRKTIGTSADDPQRQLSNLRLILKRHLRDKMSDCIVMAKGHAHKLIITEPLMTRLTTSDSKGNINVNYMESTFNSDYIHQDHRWYVCTGSFSKMYGDGISGYAEIAEYDPVDLGYAVIKVEDRNVVSVRKVII